MDNSTKNQETVLRELSKEELAAINGGVSYEWVTINGERTLIINYN